MQNELYSYMLMIVLKLLVCIKIILSRKGVANATIRLRADSQSDLCICLLHGHNPSGQTNIGYVA